MTAFFSDAEAAILSLWQSSWTATPTAYENAAFDPANLDATDLAAGFVNNEAWVELKVSELPGEGQVSTSGASNGLQRRWRLPLIVGVICNIPVGRGKAALTTLTDAAANIFRGLDFDTTNGHLIFFSPTMTPAGPSPKDAAWFQSSMIIRGWYDYYA